MPREKCHDCKEKNAIIVHFMTGDRLCNGCFKLRKKKA